MSFSNCRTEAGFTVDDVCREFGVSSATVEAWEAGKAEPPARIARTLDVIRRVSKSTTSDGIKPRQPEFDATRDEGPLYRPDRLIKSKKRVADHGEVFTPPWLVEKMLDLVKGETERIDARFLEPACGSGNFLVPILQRKLAAVEAKYGKSDFEKRHYALLALTSCYGIELLADNIAECRANMLEVFAAYLRLTEDEENHAYAFIHSDNIQARLGELFGGTMHFDVIIGNPPYQMTGGAGGTSDSSIYHLFVEQAIKLEPSFVSMVTPSRWLAGGRGMDEFRATMLSCGKLSQLVDYPVSKDVFPGVEVKGGIGYFLWSKSHEGQTAVTTIRGDEIMGPVGRDLGEFDIFVRDPRAIEILHKVQAKAEPSITAILTGDTPFGIATNFENYEQRAKPGDVALHLVKQGKRLVGYLPKKFIKKNAHLVDVWKVLTPKAGSDGGQKIPDVVLGKPLVVEPGSVCTQTFIAFWADSEQAALSIRSYYTTKFFRFLVSLRKITQDALRGTYTWVPQQAWDRTWTDAELYEKYGLTDEEIAFIESMIRPMDAAVA